MNGAGSFIAGSIVGKLLLDKTGWNQSIQAVDKDKRTLLTTASRIGEGFAAVGKTMTVAGGAIVGMFGAMLKKTADAGDQVAKLSEKLGISTELLSGYRLAAELGGLSLEGFAVGMRRLASVAVDAGRGVKGSERAFNALGISVKDSQGNMRGLEDILLDVADRFKMMEDGAVKAALAQDLFGRSGLEMIPMLNEGREGLKRHREEAERLGMVFSRESARACEDFNDRMKELKLGLAGTTKELAVQLMPVVTAFVGKVKEVIVGMREWVSAHPELVKQIGSVVLTFGGLLAVLGPAALVISKLIAAFIGLGRAIISAVGLVSRLAGVMSLSVGAWMAAAGAIGYYIIKLREKAEAERYAEEATRRNEEVTKRFREKLIGIAEQAGLTKEQFAALTEKYDGNILALARAIKRGEEGKALQEAMNRVGAERVKQMEEERKKQEELALGLDKYIPKLEDLTEKQKTFGEVMKEWGVLTVKQKAEEISRLLGYERELESMLRDGKLTLEDYNRAMSKLNDELRELGAATMKHVLPASRSMTDVLRQAVPVFQDVSYQVMTFDDLLEAAADRMGMSSMTVIRELYNIRREFLATIGIMIPEWPRFTAEAEISTRRISGAFDGLYNDIASGWSGIVEKWLEGNLTFRDFWKETCDMLKRTFLRAVAEMVTGEVLGLFKGLFSSIASGFTSTIEGAAKSAVSAVTGITQGAAGAISGLWTALGAAVGSFLGSLITGGGGLGKTEGHWIHEIRNKAFDIHNWLMSYGLNIERLLAGFYEKYDGIKESIDLTREALGSDLGDVLGAVRDGVGILANLKGAQRGYMSRTTELIVTHGTPSNPELILPIDKLFTAMKPIDLHREPTKIDLTLSPQIQPVVVERDRTIEIRFIQRALDHYELRVPIGAVRGA